MRIAVVVTTHGEQVVLQILGSSADQRPSIVGLEMEPRTEAAFIAARPCPTTLFSTAVGCAKCHGTGYVGRVALREVMPVHGELRTLIESSAEEIFAAAVRQGMTTLRDDGMRLALNGVSSVDEIRRVTGIRLI